MKLTSTFVPALLAATLTSVIAQDAATPPPATPATPARPAGFQPGGTFSRTPGAPNPAANTPRGANPLMGGGMGMGGQTPIDRIMDDDAAIAKTGIDKAKFDELRKAYKEYNDKIAEFQQTATTQADAQAKLILEKATEDEVGAAVEALWKTRAEIAKFQAFKALKSNKILTTEELDKIREVDMENVRARMGAATRPGAA